jgi:hypothetical protein
VRALTEAGKQYAVYVKGGAGPSLTLRLPDGPYRAEWLDPADGTTTKPREVRAENGRLTIDVPCYRDEVALRVVTASRRSSRKENR